MVDMLKRLVRKYDEQRNTETMMNRTQRGQSTRNVCIACRRSSSSVVNPNEVFLNPNHPCPTCGGKVYSITC